MVNQHLVTAWPKLIVSLLCILQGDIPDLAKAPSSLLEALEQHLASMENSRKTGGATPKMTSAVSSAISSYAAASKIVPQADAGVGDLSQLSDQERSRILEDEQRQLDLVIMCSIDYHAPSVVFSFLYFS